METFGNGEIWKPIPNTRLNYEVSSYGRIRRLASTIVLSNNKVRHLAPKIMEVVNSHNGVMVSIDGKMCSAAKLVGQAFIDGYIYGKILYHKDGNVANNCVDNLTTASTNQIVIEDDESLSEIDYLKKYYNITKEGDVIRRMDNKKLTPTKDNKGYLRIRLKAPQFSINPDKRKAYKVHRLVAMYYLSDYSDKLQVNHKNGIKTDNRVENLEMVTNSENALHAWTYLDVNGERRAKLRRRWKNGRYV